MNYIAFPGLGLTFSINPIAITIGGKNIYWYGIIIALGVLAGALISLYAAKKEKIVSDTIFDILIFGVPSALIGGRLYYCLFRLPYYMQNPSEIIAVWKGGIAIYGGIIGAVISTAVYCRIKKLNWKQIFDIGILGVITGQIVGRWGNFINVEAHGSETNLPWRMEIFSDADILTSVHPTFLYESIWNFIGLFILLHINKHKKRKGDTFFSYLIWYGIGRAIIESLRTDSLYLGPFRISQVVGLITALTGIIYFIIMANKKELPKN